MTGFRNHPMLELRRPEVRHDLTAALAALDRELPLQPETLVGGEGRRGEGETSTDPCAPERVIARLGWAGVDAAERALDLALASSWPVQRRPMTGRACSSAPPISSTSVATA